VSTGITLPGGENTDFPPRMEKKSLSYLANGFSEGRFRPNPIPSIKIRIIDFGRFVVNLL
jgi:hypothetical protein